VADRLNGLRTNTVICGDNQNSNVSHPRSSSPHCGEGFVTRRIKENNLLYLAIMLDIHMVSTNVLGNASGFSLSNFGLPN
jgi:hypothetical protein